jgi:hypothetical protein
MRYLKTYKIFESSDDIQSEIIDIFQPLIDISNVKMRHHPSLPELGNKKTLEISINFDRLAEPTSIKSEYDVDYRPVKDGNSIATELADAIDRCVNILGIELKRAEVGWINAGEWSQCANNGSLGKIFTSDGVVGPLDKLTKGEYSTDLLPEFIVQKGDRIRNIKLTFRY